MALNKMAKCKTTNKIKVIKGFQYTEKETLINDDLLPCPFCGSTDIERYGRAYYEDISDFVNGAKSYMPRCKSCLAGAPNWNNRISEVK